MPDPVRAWAAVAPDGRINRRSVQPNELMAKHWLGLDLQRPGECSSAAEARAYRAGWRVVPVKIVPMEGGDA